MGIYVHSALFVNANSNKSDNNNEHNPIDLYSAIITLQGYN